MGTSCKTNNTTFQGTPWNVTVRTIPHLSFSRFMSGRWLSSLVEAVSTAQSLSWSLSCPIHCGNSFLPWFLSGISLGFLLGFITLALSLWHFGLLPLHPYSPHPPFSSGSSRVSPPSSYRSTARLAGYLHGPDSNSR